MTNLLGVSALLDLSLSRSAAVLVGLLALVGCESLPSGGPRPPTVPLVESEETLPHIFVPVTTRVVDLASKSLDRTSLGELSAARRGKYEVRLGVGDVVAVTIFEASAGGLFIPAEAGSRSGNFVTFPDQQIDKNGNISIPYAGAVAAAGRMIPEVQATIEERLRNRAIEPQAIITVKQQLSSLVSVLGEVNTPLRAPINPAGERVLDAISQAGGPRYPGYETYLTLTRGDQKRTIYFNRLVNEPSNNIFVQPGDTIYVFRENRSFVVLGATGLNGKYNFEQETLTVSEALGKGGGLLDERANPGAVYIYRLEPRQTAIDLGFDPKPFPGERVPVIYSFDLRADRSFFLTSGFQVRDKDIIYVANAAAVELLKALTVIRSAVASGQDVRDVARRN